MNLGTLSWKGIPWKEHWWYCDCCTWKMRGILRPGSRWHYCRHWTTGRAVSIDQSATKGAARRPDSSVASLSSRGASSSSRPDAASVGSSCATRPTCYRHYRCNCGWRRVGRRAALGSVLRRFVAGWRRRWCWSASASTLRPCPSWRRSRAVRWRIRQSSPAPVDTGCWCEYAAVRRSTPSATTCWLYRRRGNSVAL